MNNEIYWAWAIKNSICVICWTALAIASDTWWIALFGLLFMTSIQFTRHYKICDKCGKHSEYAETREKAIEKALKAGWVHYEDGNKDYCPECMNRNPI